jgi:nucleoside-diphosphate kinase
MKERTLAIVKPDGVARGLVGEVIKRIEADNLKIIDIKMVHLTKEQAGEFYAVHKGSLHFDGLTTFTSSGPIVVMILEGLHAISRWRALVGATKYIDAVEGTIRRDFAHPTIIRHNVVHGSDTPDTAAFEISYFFNTS